MSRQQVFAPRRRPFAASSRYASFIVIPVSLLGMGLAAASCGTTENYYETQYVFPSRGDAGASSTPPDEPDAGGTPEPEPTDAGGEQPPEDGLPTIDTDPEALAVDVLGQAGNRYYFLVSDEQLAQMNERYGGGGGFPVPGIGNGDIYTPGGGAGGITFVDHLLVTTAGKNPKTADFGKVQVKLVGESTGRPWTTETLPNFKIDSDEFMEGNRIGGVKHLRLNNAIVGSIFREKLTLDLYAKLGYPAPRASYAWVQSSVWGPEISVPYIVVEAYKPAFCKQREADMGGGCVNMWEFAGDLGFGQLAAPESCQFSECDPDRALDFEAAAVGAEQGPGFKAALADWFDWDAFHQFQCLSWILATGDDVLHNTNNFVMMERADGKFQHLPYSVDISLGQEWYPRVELAGSSLMARGCQADPQCWDDLIATCDVMVDEFIAANPISMLDQTYALLSQQGMLRDGDDERYEALSSYLAQRIEELPLELEENREGPPVATCEFPLVPCGDSCIYFEEECPICEPDPGEEPEPLPDAGVDELARGAAADVAIPGPIDPGIPVDPGGPACRPPIDEYPIPVPRPRPL
ncbi:MAG TPA: CotH kinase family protein [Polyangiaceae bacterium]|nr:CotH kinase family protein [Polyangiaceae bacterium]